MTYPEFKFIPDDSHDKRDLELHKEYCELKDIFNSIDFIANNFKESYTVEMQSFKYNVIAARMSILNSQLSDEFKNDLLKQILIHRDNNEKLKLKKYFECMNKINAYKNGGISNEEKEAEILDQTNADSNSETKESSI